MGQMKDSLQKAIDHVVIEWDKDVTQSPALLPSIFSRTIVYAFSGCTFPPSFPGLSCYFNFPQLSLRK